MNALILLAAAAAPALAGSELAPLARELAAAARSAGLTRVAVTGFEPASGRDDGTGVVLTERLTVALARTHRIQTIERRLLPRLMEEIALGRSGATPSAPRLGRVLTVDAIITGTWVPAPRGVRVLARLVQIETGLIIAAAETRVETDAPPSWSVGDPFSVPVPELGGGELSFAGGAAENVSLRDAPASPVPSCDGAAERVDRMEERVLDLKARYWALRLREGVIGSSLTSNPGSTITDPELRARFYERLKAWHARPEIPSLSALEVRQFVETDGAAYSLHRDCML